MPDVQEKLQECAAQKEQAGGEADCVQTVISLGTRQFVYSKGPYIKDVRKIFEFFDPLPPLVRILARAIRVNPRNLPYYVCFWATPLPPPGADVLYVWPLTKDRRLFSRTIDVALFSQ